MDTTPVTLLLELRKAPSEDSWTRFVNLYGPVVKRLLFKAGIRSSDIDDIHQEVFAAVIEEARHFEHSGRVGAFRTWLRLLICHRVQRHWRAKSKREKTTLSDGTTDFVSRLAIEDSDLTRAWNLEHDRFVLARALEIIEPEFTATTWEAFRRQAIYQQSPSSVGSALGITANAAVIAKSRVLRRLRAEIKSIVDDA